MAPPHATSPALHAASSSFPGNPSPMSAVDRKTPTTQIQDAAAPREEAHDVDASTPPSLLTPQQQLAAPPVTSTPVVPPFPCSTKRKTTSPATSSTSSPAVADGAVSTPPSRSPTGGSSSPVKTQLLQPLDLESDRPASSYIPVLIEKSQTSSPTHLPLSNSMQPENPPLGSHSRR